MPAPIAAPIRQAIIVALSPGHETEQAIAERYGVSHPTVTRLKRRWKETGSVAPRTPRQKGPVIRPLLTGRLVRLARCLVSGGQVTHAF